MRSSTLAVQSFLKRKSSERKPSERKPSERKPSERIFAEYRSAAFLFH